MTESGGLRERKKQQTRHALMVAALEMVAGRGLEHTTVEDVCATVGVSTRTFFNYFATKEEPLTGDHFVSPGEFAELLAAVPAGDPPLAAVRVALRPAVARMQADRELWLLRLNVVMANRQLLPSLVAAGAEAERGMAAAVAARVGASADDGYPMLLAAAVTAALRVAVFRWAFDPAGRELGEFVDTAFETLSGGLRPAATTTSTGR
ncbi:TetR/AcrR family transcriptional regulator [Dactylosporangium fulvum]|uniref:TetR/AcrR family transcriptional regulator n=1 Tax=Dactylosporangium fulvum TaxID=53359 RepID=A0ABY5W9U1_9ACTN|nr:TetR/AcrR family transcriptional regulator [Dactylosporangium fulvum]UWP86259.1 TetR/AcrR family transcriptional regulator [Dactylosporangium fulvum]